MLSLDLAWRADCAKQHEDTVNAVRLTASEQVPFNVQGVSYMMTDNWIDFDLGIQYLDDFSKALASEVRILLGEVGKLREERRSLQLYVPQLKFPIDLIHFPKAR